MLWFILQGKSSLIMGIQHKYLLSSADFGAWHLRCPKVGIAFICFDYFIIALSIYLPTSFVTSRMRHDVIIKRGSVARVVD